ncbi:MAG: hypothetical protein BWY52_03178 [Chloroflexi bacterium ADurb.Bin325]|nr:MAG: hypothetical protein BWY52_03178 [Chloroflexi bacterium ADurb.Bin325]
MIDKKTAIVIGAAVGAALGATAAYAYARIDQRSQANGLSKLQLASQHIDSADYVKLGMALVGVARMVARMLKPV